MLADWIELYLAPNSFAVRDFALCILRVSGLSFEMQFSAFPTSQPPNLELLGMLCVVVEATTNCFVVLVALFLTSGSFPHKFFFLTLGNVCGFVAVIYI